MHPRRAVASLRSRVGHDDDVLRAMRSASERRYAQDSALRLCFDEAAMIERCELPSTSSVDRLISADHHKTQVLAAKYQKKGKRARQEELFPERQKEIVAERLKLDKEVIWPDQNAQKYKEHIAERCQDKVKHLTPKRAAKFLEKVVKLFRI